MRHRARLLGMLAATMITAGLLAATPRADASESWCEGTEVRRCILVAYYDYQSTHVRARARVEDAGSINQDVQVSGLRLEWKRWSSSSWTTIATDDSYDGWWHTAEEAETVAPCREGYFRAVARYRWKPAGADAATSTVWRVTDQARMC